MVENLPYQSGMGYHSLHHRVSSQLKSLPQMHQGDGTVVHGTVTDGFRYHGMMPHKHYQSQSRSYHLLSLHVEYGGSNGNGNLLSATATIRP